MTDTAQPEQVGRLTEERRGRLNGRGSVVALLLVLGCGLVAAALIAWFVRATVLDTDRYVETMAPIAESDDVQRAMAGKLDGAITSRIDFDALMREALPARADPLAPALAGALREAIRTRIDAFVASDEFETVWREANRRAHSRVVALLTTGESERLLLEGDTVYLDLSAAVDGIREGLQERGLDRLAAAIPPTVDGRVTLLQSEGFVKARRGIDLLEGLAIVLPLLALLCLAGHVALSRPRRRGLLRVGLGLIVTALLLLVALGVGRSAYLDAIDQEVLPRQAAADIFDALIGLLRAGVRAVVLVALIVALLALVVGRTDRLAVRSRRLAGSATLGWVARHRGALQGAAVALGALVLVAWDPPTAGLVVIDGALVVGAVALIAAIDRAGRARAA